MRNILFFAFLSLLICSCLKEKSQVGRTENPPGDSTTLAMYVDLDTTKQSGLDTLTVQKYSYDNLKRLSKSYFIDYFEGLPLGPNITELFYKGNDTLPFKIIETYYESPAGSANEPDTGYYFYKDGKLSSDSVTYPYSPSEYRVLTYSYDNNVISSTHKYGSTPPSNSVYKYYHTKNNGNTASQLDSSFENGIYSDSKVTFSASYDNKNNPFRKLEYANIEIIPSFIYGIETYSEDMSSEKNNPLEIISGFHLKFVYDYNKHDYPIVARVYDMGGSSKFWFKRIFIYTKL